MERGKITPQGVGRIADWVRCYQQDADAAAILIQEVESICQLGHGQRTLVRAVCVPEVNQHDLAACAVALKRFALVIRECNRWRWPSGLKFGSNKPPGAHTRVRESSQSDCYQQRDIPQWAKSARHLGPIRYASQTRPKAASAAD
jgi:hypothetical protein